MKNRMRASFLAVFLMGCIPPSTGGGRNTDGDAATDAVSGSSDAQAPGTDGAAPGDTDGDTDGDTPVQDGSLPPLLDAAPAIGDADPSPVVDGGPDPEDMSTPRPLPDRGVVPDQGPDRPGDAAVDLGPQLDCEPGSARCLEEGDQGRERCNEDGLWQRLDCDDGDICADGQCLPDPAFCENGELTCLPDGRPARCQDAAWRPQNPCPRGQACSQGECTPRACAEAAANQSSMGCEFHAADLPNLAFAEVGGTTVDAPAAVVLVNPSADSEVSASIHSADGEPTRLIAEQRIAVPPGIDLPEDLFQAQTITSHTRVGDRIVEDRIERGAIIDIPPRGTAVLLLPRRLGPNAVSSIAPNAFRVRTNRPVAAYQYSPYCCNFSFSNDASLLLPTHSLGRSYVFAGTPLAVLGLARDARNPPVIAITAVRDRTEVDVRLPPRAQVANGEGEARMVNGHVRATLSAQEILLVTGDTLDVDGAPPLYDFTGATITASAPVSVFSVHLCATFPQDIAACDALQDQLLPVSKWARRYPLVPLVERGMNSPREMTYWKITADAGNGDQDGVRIRFSTPFAALDPSPPGYPGVGDCADRFEDDVLVLRPLEYCEFGTKRPVVVTADRPVQVTGMLVGQEATQMEFAGFGLHAGDPALFVMPGESHYRRDYVFTMPETYARGHVTLVSPPRNELRLNGSVLDNLVPIAIPGSDLVYYHLNLAAGTYRLDAEFPVGMVIYGFDDFVSFAYPGGFQIQAP